MFQHSAVSRSSADSCFDAQTFTKERTVPVVAPEPRARWSYASSDRAVATETIGVDVYIESEDDPDAIGERLREAAAADFHLAAVTSRGTIAWPAGSAPSTSPRAA